MGCLSSFKLGKVKDNAGNVSEHNNLCKFRVNTDIQTPSAEITAYKGLASNANDTNTLSSKITGSNILKKTVKEVRVTVPGHTQRGGSPCPYDRVFASRLGAEAGKLILKGEYGFMVGYKNREIVKVPLDEVAGKLKMVDPKSSIIKEAKMLGISFGD